MLAVLPNVRSGSVLLVDDDPMLRELGQRMLDRLAETVHIVGSGAEALSFLASHSAEVSVIITDLTMPEMSGLELIEQLAVRHPAIPVVAVSGFAVNLDARAELDARRIPFVAKPFTLQDLQRALERVGGYTLSPDERVFAEKLQKSEAFIPVALEATQKIKPLVIGQAGSASTDVGDVSWTVPTVQLGAATWVPGTAAHSWQAVAAGGMSIGTKGMMVAAKTMALTAADLFVSPAALAEAKKEFDAKRGPNFKYETLIGNQKPQLDYRKGTTN
jgi:CheY-like chemotaxis protein